MGHGEGEGDGYTMSSKCINHFCLHTSEGSFTENYFFIYFFIFMKAV